MIIQRIARSKYGVMMWLVIAVVVFGVSVGAGYMAATWQGEKLLVVENKQGLYTPETSDQGMEEYLRYAGLIERVEQVKLIYEPARLETYAYTRELPDATLDVMMDLKVEDKVVRVRLYYNPELFEQMLAEPERLAGDMLAGVCLAMKPGTMPTCMERAFEFIDWSKEAGVPAVIQPVTQQSWWRRLVPQAYAGCSGTIPCGADKTVCSCSSGGASCSYSGQSCNSGFGTCQCQTTCDESQNRLNCSSLTNQTLCTTQGYLSSCANKCSTTRDGSINYCSWSNTGGATPTPGGATATPAPPGGSDRWRIKGRVQYYNDLNLSGATVTVEFKNSSGTVVATETDTTDASGLFSWDKNRANVLGTSYVVTARKSGHRTLETKGNAISGCTKNTSNWTCSKSAGDTNSEAATVYNFEEVAPTLSNRPNATISNVSNLTNNQTLNWTVTVADADGNAKESGIFIHRGTPAIGVTTEWTQFKWVQIKQDIVIESVYGRIVA